MSDGGIISGFLIILLAGFAGSFHCVAMCGGFACGLCSDPNTSVPKLVTRHLFYNLGRLATYLFIGALAGQFGALIVVAVTQQPSAAVATHGHTMMPITPFFLIGELGILQRVVACVAGLLMLLMALQLLGLYRSSPKSWRAFGGVFFVDAIGSLMRSRRGSAALALGVVNGFLPCPLVYAFAVIAAGTGSVIMGVLTMAAFGLGTFPAMLFMGALGRIGKSISLNSGARYAGYFVLLVGVLTLVRGLAPGLLHLGGHA